MGHTNSLILAATLICLHGSGAWAQTSATTPQQTSTTAPQEDRLPVNIHGTIRSKYEYQTQENEGRFEVRNARVSVDGKLSPIIGYKAEIDLCDEGKIKMLDAYTRLKPAQGLQLTLGQMRVPFTIDAHSRPTSSISPTGPSSPSRWATCATWDLPQATRSRRDFPSCWRQDSSTGRD